MRINIRQSSLFDEGAARLEAAQNCGNALGEVLELLKTLFQVAKKERGGDDR